MAISISIGLLVVSVVAGIIFIPSLYANRHCLRSKFVITQQVCIVSHLILTLLIELMPRKSLAFLSMFDYSKNTIPVLVEFHIFVSQKLMQMISYFAYYNFYFMSFMQNFDLYTMICNPMGYEIFKETKNVMKLITIGLVICLAASSDHLLFILIRMKYPINKRENLMRDNDAQINMSFAVGIFNAVKFAVMKICYTVAIVRMAIRTRKALQQSAELSNNKNKTNLNRRLFVLTLIPLLLSMLFTVHELFHVVKPFIIVNLDDGCSTHFLYRKDVFLGVYASSFTFGSFVYYASYLILFPKIRNSFFHCC